VLHVSVFVSINPSRFEPVSCSLINLSGALITISNRYQFSALFPPKFKFNRPRSRPRPRCLQRVTAAPPPPLPLLRRAKQAASSYRIL
jgi:hypothetical protein